LRIPTSERLSDFKKAVQGITKTQFLGRVSGEDILFEILLKCFSFDVFEIYLKIIYLESQNSQNILDELTAIKPKMFARSLFISLQDTVTKKVGSIPPKGYLKNAKGIGVFSDNDEVKKSPYASFFVLNLVDYLKGGLSENKSYILLAQLLPVYCPNHYSLNTNKGNLKQRATYFSKNEKRYMGSINNLEIPILLEHFERSLKNYFSSREKLKILFGLTDILA